MAYTIIDHIKATNNSKRVIEIEDNDKVFFHTTFPLANKALWNLVISQSKSLFLNAKFRSGNHGIWEEYLFSSPLRSDCLLVSFDARTGTISIELETPYSKRAIATFIENPGIYDFSVCVKSMNELLRAAVADCDRAEKYSQTH